MELDLPAQTILLAVAELASDKDVSDIVSKLPKLVKAFPNEETYISHNSENHIEDIIQALKGYENVLDKKRIKSETISYSNIEIGTVIDERYRVLNKIGQGGMSIVYLAENIRLNVLCAIKVFRFDCFDKSCIKEAFEQECYLMKKFNYSGLPRVSDVLRTDNASVIVMDYIEGDTLEQLLQEEGPQLEVDVIEWAKQLCGILNYLHTRKPPIIYRDIKPLNIIKKSDGTLMLIDFGTAMEYIDGVTCDICCIGTRGYAAPEQFGGLGQSDSRTDIYGLGVTLYRLVTGCNPSSPSFEIKPIRQIRPELSYGLEYIISKCTQTNRINRYQSANELLEDLNEIDKIGKQLRSIFSRIKNKKTNTTVSKDNELKTPPPLIDSENIVVPIINDTTTFLKSETTPLY